MFKKVFFICLALGTSLPAFAISKTPELVTFRDGILRKRVLLHASLRALGIRDCVRNHLALPSTTREEALALAQKILQENSALKIQPETSPEKAIEVLQLLKDTGKFNKEGVCRAEISLREKGLRQVEREKFIYPEKVLKGACGNPLTYLFAFDSAAHCRQTMKTLVQELDPSCVKNAGAFFGTNNVETNPCFAGTRIIVDSLYAVPKAKRDNPETLEAFQWELFHFLIGYDQAIAAASTGGQVELWPIFDRGRGLHSRQSKRFFLAMLTFLATAGTSERGYMGQVYEEIWFSALRNRIAPAEVYALHGVINDANDFYMNLFANGLNKNLRITVQGTEITRHNRHNFIAAMLSCHFGMTDREEFADSVPVIMGYAYETLDFISHREKGISWDASVKNFEEDTQRYVESSEWGKAFCQ